MSSPTLNPACRPPIKTTAAAKQHPLLAMYGTREKLLQEVLGVDGMSELLRRHFNNTKTPASPTDAPTAPVTLSVLAPEARRGTIAMTPQERTAANLTCCRRLVAEGAIGDPHSWRKTNRMVRGARVKLLTDVCMLSKGAEVIAIGYQYTPKRDMHRIVLRNGDGVVLTPLYSIVFL